MNKKDYDKVYRSANRERYAEHSRNWRAKNKERAREIDAKKYQNQRKELKMLQGAKERATKHNLPFNLTVEDIVIPTHCPVLGIKLESGSHRTRPELDRIIPKLGYVKGNVCVISGRANRIKYNATVDELQAVASYIASKSLSLEDI